MIQCNVCHGSNLISHLQDDALPLSQTAVNPTMAGTEPTGRMDLCHCADCGHVFNRAFDPATIEQIYSTGFAASLPMTASYLDKYRTIASEAIGQEVIADRNVVEIGAGDFTFSKLLLETGAREVLAFEPSDVFSTKEIGIRHLREYFRPDLVSRTFAAKSVFVLRHVLEHMVAPLEIVGGIAETMGEGSYLYIEVPNMSDILKQSRFYDVFYEHTNYFTPELVESIGNRFCLKTVRTTLLSDGQHFGTLFKKEGKISASPIPIKQPKLVTTVELGLQRLKAFRDKDLDQFRSVIEGNQPLAIYGSGAHSITVLALLKMSKEKVRFLLDINPHKTGKVSPVTQIPVFAPDQKKVNEVATIFVIASLHEKEIIRNLRQSFGFKGKIFGSYPTIREVE